MFSKCEPWEKQYFNIDIDIDIPVDDVSAYEAYPHLRWMFDKRALLNSIGIETIPHGIEPTEFPVFSKPITNLYGMGMGAEKIDKWSDELYTPGHFIMPFLEGDHLSIDVALYNGNVRWHAAMQGHSADVGVFTHWKYVECPDSILEFIKEWSSEFLPTHSGIVNFELIGDTMIEFHPRMTCQWVDLYGKGWLQSVIELYKGNPWKFDCKIEEGYSCVLWTEDDGRYDWVSYVNSDIMSHQLTYDPEHLLSEETNPNSFYRLAVVNGRNLDNCEAAIKELSLLIQRYA